MAAEFSDTCSWIDEDVKKKFREREATFKYLTGNRGNPGKGITPIIMEFADGTKEQRGMRLSLNGARPAAGDLNIIFCTHHNETAILDGIKLVLEAFRKNPESFKGKGVNILLGGQKERCEAFFRRVIDDRQRFITADDLESYRNTTRNVNCNRVPKARIEPPDSTPGSLGWLQQIHDFYDRSFYGKADENSKELTITFDGHTTSNPSGVLAVFYGRTLEQGKQFKELAAYTGAEGVFCEKTDDLPTWYMCESATPAANKLPFLYESKKHMDLDAGLAAERGIVGLFSSLGITIPSKVAQPSAQMLTFYRDTSLLYTPASPNARLNPPGVVPAMEKPGQWHGDVQLINSMDDVPEDVREYFKARDVAIKPPENGLKNGADVRKGDHIAWTRYRTDDGEIIPVLLTSPKDGVSFMAPQKSLIPRGFPDSIVEIQERDQTFTIPLPDGVKVGDPAQKPQHAILERKQHERIKRGDPGMMRI